MMKRLCPLLLALPLAACSVDGFDVSDLAAVFEPARPDTRPLTAPITSVSRPSAGLPHRMDVTSLVDGSRKTYSARAYGNGVRVQESDGCVWTRANDWFSPSDSWANCGESSNWHTAQAEVRELDTIYPLRLGSIGRYQRSALSHTGRGYARETRCEVTDAVEVLRAGQTATPAFVVECDDNRRLRTTWYAPGEGPIAFRVVHRRNGVEEAWVRNR